MNRRLSSVALLALLIVVSDARDARACSCMTGTPLCETLWKTPVVFAGEVIDITDVPGGFDSRLPENRRVTFRVEQSWREDVPREVHVRTGSGGGDCGYPFIKGVRYLVFAHRNGEQLTTTICSPTKPISDAGEDLEYLKTAFKPSVAGRVFGRVTFQRSDPDAPAMPMKGYALTLSDGRKERSTKTDADGRYEFNGVSTRSVRSQARCSVDRACLWQEGGRASRIREDVRRPISMSSWMAASRRGSFVLTANRREVRHWRQSPSKVCRRPTGSRHRDRSRLRRTDGSRFRNWLPAAT